MDKNELPLGYSEKFKIDLKKNKRTSILVNAAAIILGVGMAVITLLYEPLTLFESVGSAFVTLLYMVLKVIVAMGGLVLCISLHERIHGMFIKKFSGTEPSYGISGAYAYAGSTAYFQKTHYIIIALSPVVIIGIVLAVITLFLPEGWFWYVYIIQIFNVAGAVGDIYVSLRILFQPKNVLVQDSGTEMTIYTQEGL